MISESIPKLPVGLLVQVDSSGNARAVHDVNGIEEMARRFNEVLGGPKNDEAGEV